MIALWFKKMIEDFRLRRFMNNPRENGYLVEVSFNNTAAYQYETIPWDPFLGDRVLKRTEQLTDFLADHVYSNNESPSFAREIVSLYFMHKEDAVLAKLMFG